MVTNTNTKYAQVYNPQTKRWVKINSRPGYIVGSKGTAGAYKGIPKQRRIPKWLQKMWDRAKSERSQRPGRKSFVTAYRQRLIPKHRRIPKQKQKMWDKVKGEPRQRPGGKPQVHKTRRVSPPPQRSKKPQVPKYRPGHHPASIPLRRSGSSGTARVRRMR